MMRSISGIWRWTAALGVLAVGVLSWPGPAGATPPLGGYQAEGSAEVVRVQIFDSGLPIPVNQGQSEVDGGVAYTDSSATTGPTTSAKASYLWPGDAIGNGFGQFTGNPNSTYPVQVNSTYPASTSAPAANTIQISNGNGMTTSTNGTQTASDVTLAGVSGSDPTGGPLSGLGNLLNGKPNKPNPKDPLPVNIGKNLSTLVTAKNVTSSSHVTVTDHLVTTTAEAAVSQLALLGGIITLDGVSVTSTTTSDGTKATATGKVTVGGLSIAGQPIALTDHGLQLGSTTIKLPDLSTTVNAVLKALGISIGTTPVHRTVSGATGSYSAQALVITIDTTPFQSGLTALNSLLSLLPSSLYSKLGTLTSVLSVAPKFVLSIGNVDNSTVASPGFASGGGTTAGGGATPASNPAGPTTTGGGGTGGGAGTTGGGGVTPVTTPHATTPGGAPAAVSAPAPVALQPTAFNLPGLGSVPRMLIVGGILLAGVLGWLFRIAGGLLLGGGRGCAFGLPSGVPDLRKV